MTTIRLILGDQLNLNHSWFQELKPNVHYLMIESRVETDYVRHHIQKIAAFFLAMREFASQLTALGHSVIYLTIDNPQNKKILEENLSMILRQRKAERFEYQLPDEFRVDQKLSKFCESLTIAWQATDSEHFFSSRNDFAEFFSGKKNYIMENFYRHMRRRFNILMSGDQPEGGQWNFDKANRQSYDQKVALPEALSFDNNVSEILRQIRESEISTIGKIDGETIPFPVTRDQSLQLLSYFCENLLPWFGTYQDAMLQHHQTLFHSRLSFALNVKLISAPEVIDAAIAVFRKQQTKGKTKQNQAGTISIEQIEGFVRQILGWREFMRGLYWAQMPSYKKLNYFEHDRPLPSWYWNAQTDLNCMRTAISQSLNTAYAHHIQRLMITGNFALLTGIHPDEVDAWYLGIYIDAIEWVEITNTRGMSQYADGGMAATKPYVSSANYIHKMSDYCRSCRYDYRKKTGNAACPFNSLYWYFFAKNQDRLKGNPRLNRVYHTLDKLANQEAIFHQAEQYLQNLENL
ncbi:MAG: cryptochrome/photolyase family protein [Leptospiraceae bacterium]|nr:cryptochrome/photolyase family protein [Leptospiraceae bacterium]